MRGELEPDAAARTYEEELRRAFGVTEGEYPRFDLILLGLGDNRHTLSLFPGHEKAIHEAERMVIAVTVEAEPSRRITFTPALANSAERLMFIASGAGKAEAVRDVLEGPRDPISFPAQIIQPEDGEVIWLIDRPAARLLSRR
jgi:6-phosphogluconolactonase